MNLRKTELIGFPKKSVVVFNLKCEARAPHHIAYKPSTPQLYADQKLSDQLPLGYDNIDEILARVYDDKVLPESIEDLQSEDVKYVMYLYFLSEHKRHMPPTLNR
jgi:NH3-dependent NAD+ synthetase